MTTHHPNMSTSGERSQGSAQEKSTEVGREPPDGGLHAWMQVVAGHLIAFNCWGFVNSFGIFQAYLTGELNQTPDNISWVGGMQVFLLMFLGAFSGRGLDAGYYRPLAIIGLFLQVFGVFMTSLVTKYWQLFLAQGLCQGIGGGLVFTPTMAIVASYFLRKRGLAVVGMSSGTATGGIIFPVIARQCLATLGFGWTVRIMGFIFLFNACVAVTIIQPRNSPRRIGPVIELRSFLDPWYGCASFGLFFCMFGLYFGYFYLSSFAEDVLNTSDQTAFVLTIVMNAMGIPGRFIPAFLSDKYVGPLNTLIISAFGSGVLIYGWAGIHSLESTWAFTILFGYCGASISSFFPAALVQAKRDPSKIGTEIGMCFALMGVGCLCGPPIGGALIHATGRYLPAQMFAGSMFMVGIGLLSISRFLNSGSKLLVRA